MNKKYTDIREKKNSSVRVYDGFLQIYKDNVTLPDGGTATREYVLHPGAAMVIPVLENGHFLMIEQYRHAVGEIFLEFPAGKRDPGEDSSQTAKRELAEEVGLSAGQLHFLTKIHPAIGISNEFIDLFVATDLKPVVQNHQEDEFLILKEVSVSELEKKVFSGQVTDVKTQIGFFWYLKNILKK